MANASLRAQQNHRLHIQNFLLWMQRSHVETDGASTGLEESAASRNRRKRADLEDFVPEGYVKEHLEREDNLKLILEDLELVVTQRESRLIASRCSKIFAILVSIGKGQYIRHCVTYQLYDDKLPFSTKPPVFPLDPSDNTTDDFFDKFEREQWRFCAVVFEDWSGTPWGQQHIMPFTDKTWIAKGATADVYKVVLHPRHDKMKGWDDMSRLPTQGRCFALKVYKNPDGQRWHDLEVHAFEKFGHTGLEETHMIGFYCSYQHQDRWHALFEYADMGTLEQFMQATDPPGTNEEVRAFWTNFIQLTIALNQIHELDPDNDGLNESSPSSGQIVHQDIKPQNILLTSQPGLSAYDYHIGLADLGSSRFSATNSNGTMKHSRADKTYGPPECHRQDRVEDLRNIRITTKADIWSFGAVLSEVCVWVLFGRSKQHGLDAYRTRRKDALTGRSQGSECFHDDGMRVLGVVEEEHHKLMAQERCGHVTRSILEMMPQMLHLNSDARTSAADLRRRFVDILKEAESPRQAPLASPTSPTIAFPRQPRERAATAPSPFPTSPTRLGPRLNPLYAAGDRRAGIIPFRPNSGSSSRSDSLQSLTIETNGLGIQGDTSPLGIVEERPQTSANVIRRSQPHRGSKAPQVDSVGTHTSTLSSRTPPTRSEYTIGSPQLQPDSIPMQTSMLTTPLNTRHSPDSYEFETSELDVPTDSASPGPRKPLGLPVEHSHGSSASTKAEAPAYLSFDEAERWCNAHGHKSLRRLTDDGMFQYLKGRDHVFIVDDSGSMAKFRQSHKHGCPNVTNLIRVLAYMVKDTDPNGLDLCFFRSGATHSAKSSKLAQAVSSHTFEGLTNPFHALQSQLKSYREDLEMHRLAVEKYQHRHSGSHFSGSWPRKRPLPPRPRNIYVLTDGVWESPASSGGDYVNDLISNVVGELDKAQLSRDHLGVQFIMFDSHPHGMPRLKELDNLGKTLGLKFDIVDMEPASGNVWKMLLGAINDRFDIVDEVD